MIILFILHFFFVEKISFTKSTILILKQSSCIKQHFFNKNASSYIYMQMIKKKRIFFMNWHPSTLFTDTQNGFYQKKKREMYGKIHFQAFSE